MPDEARDEKAAHTRAALAERWNSCTFSASEAPALHASSGGQELLGQQVLRQVHSRYCFSKLATRVRFILFKFGDSSLS